MFGQVGSSLVFRTDEQPPKTKQAKAAASAAYTVTPRALKGRVKPFTSRYCMAPSNRDATRVYISSFYCRFIRKL